MRRYQRYDNVLALYLQTLSLYRQRVTRVSLPVNNPPRALANANSRVYCVRCEEIAEWHNRKLLCPPRFLRSRNFFLKRGDPVRVL